MVPQFFKYDSFLLSSDRWTNPGLLAQLGLEVCPVQGHDVLSGPAARLLFPSFTQARRRLGAGDLHQHLGQVRRLRRVHLQEQIPGNEKF